MLFGIIMSGGKGSRIESPTEKPMMLVNGKPMIEYVINALVKSREFKRIIISTSANTPYTNRFLKERYHDNDNNTNITVFDSAGMGYSKDLGSILEVIKPEIGLIVPADLPLLTQNVIKEICKMYNRVNNHSPCLSIILDEEFVTQFGLKPSVKVRIRGRTYCHSGVSFFDSKEIIYARYAKESYLKFNAKEIAFNINNK
jgi:adenosylcobinamide-phosphate guanylyltransferase